MMVFIWHIIHIFNYEYYNLSDSKLFFNTKDLAQEVDISEIMKDFSFGFHYNNKIINMLDNEYAHITLEWQYKKNEKEKYNYEIGMHQC